MTRGSPGLISAKPPQFKRGGSVLRHNTGLTASRRRAACPSGQALRGLQAVI
ncbi:hypothetical protein BSIN_3666 [Burkholderia singularis]|uniref:Uncharacterized protein n=1 Tax=Burkholderia singularis TaxID=1503053 RepID=A0A238H5S8_9BURK|nr:hypothetical protein BSIN_3666 [Burkholderia singularis]